MKISGLQKYFLLLLLSFGIVQGSYACFSSINVKSSNKSTRLYSNNSQSLHANYFFELVEENIDEDSDNFHFSVDFIISTNHNFTFQKLQNETILFQSFLSSQPFYNQKINILNCSFLI